MQDVTFFFLLGTMSFRNQRADAIVHAGHPGSKLPGFAENSPKTSAVSEKSYYLLENGTSRELYA